MDIMWNSDPSGRWLSTESSSMSFLLNINVFECCLEDRYESHLSKQGLSSLHFISRGVGKSCPFNWLTSISQLSACLVLQVLFLKTHP